MKKTFMAKVVQVGDCVPEGKGIGPGVVLLTKSGQLIKIPTTRDEAQAFAPSFGDELEITVRTLP